MSKYLILNIIIENVEQRLLWTVTVYEEEKIKW